jgi:hypothetical protein
MSKINNNFLIKNDVGREYHLKNLMALSSRISEVEYFIFFGTLLGYCREGNLNKMDDDIDFYVNIGDRNKIIIILESLGFKGNICTEYFIQASRSIEGVYAFVDFYFYEDYPDRDYLIERWNFKYSPNDASTHLHIPKKIIFPIRQGTINNIKINIPNDVKSCCHYLYGDHYNTPLIKGSDYSTKIVNNKPTTILNDDPINFIRAKIPIFIIVKDQFEKLVETIKYFHSTIEAPLIIFIHDHKTTDKKIINFLEDLEENGNKIYWQQNCDKRTVQIIIDAWLQNNVYTIHYFITDSITSFIKPVNRL